MRRERDGEGADDIRREDGGDGLERRTRGGAVRKAMLALGQAWAMVRTTELVDDGDGDRGSERNSESRGEDEMLRDGVRSRLVG